MRILDLDELVPDKDVYLYIDPSVPCWARPAAFCRRFGEAKVINIDHPISSFWWEADGYMVTLDTVDYGIKWRCEELPL